MYKTSENQPFTCQNQTKHSRDSLNTQLGKPKFVLHTYQLQPTSTPFMHQYSFTTEWQFEAPVEAIWEVIYAMDQWPDWWKYVKKVEYIKTGVNGDIGSIRRIKWGTALPYSLTFNSELLAVDPFKRIQGSVFGELEGKGIWTFTSREHMTYVRYDWKVNTTKKWMNLLAPIARPLFNWNHDIVMKAGYEGLKKKISIDS